MSSARTWRQEKHGGDREAIPGRSGGGRGDQPGAGRAGINVSLPVSGVLTSVCNGQVDFVGQGDVSNFTTIIREHLTINANGDIVNISNELETFCK